MALARIQANVRRQTTGADGSVGNSHWEGRNRVAIETATRRGIKFARVQGIYALVDWAAFMVLQEYTSAGIASQQKCIFQAHTERVNINVTGRKHSNHTFEG